MIRMPDAVEVDVGAGDASALRKGRLRPVVDRNDPALCTIPLRIAT